MKKILSIFWFALLLFSCQKEDELVVVPDFLPPCESTTVLDSIIPNSLDRIVEDMSLAHEGRANGIPSHYDWSEYPRMGWGNTPDTTWSAMIPWGQIYRDQSPLLAEHTRIQIKNIKAYYLSRSSNEWIKWVETSQVEGAYYREDFVGDVSVPTAIRVEEEGISIQLIKGYNFHFWSGEGRVIMNPTDIEGVWIAIDARLIAAPNATDDRCHANFLMSVGGDYWKSLSAPWDQWTTNGDIAISRFRYITNSWQTFNMHSLSRQQLRENPPPF
jgi:hypothetical protein